MNSGRSLPSRQEAHCPVDSVPGATRIPVNSRWRNRSCSGPPPASSSALAPHAARQTSASDVLHMGPSYARGVCQDSPLVRLLRWPANLLRGLFLLLFLLVVSVVYGIGRLILWLSVRDRQERERRVARWRGRVLRRSMTMLGATFIKMGQVLSSRPDLLPPETIEQLKVLQDRLPAFGFRRVRRSVEAELGRPLEEVFSEFDRQPVAAASVAQVHRARLVDGGAEVAVKVLRPSIR